MRKTEFKVSVLRAGALVFLLLLTSPARAELLTVKDAISTAQAVSPEIKGLQNQVLSAEAKVRLALTPYEPSLTLTYGDMPNEFQFHQPASVGLFIQEQIGFPGRAFLSRAQQSNQAHALEAQLHAVELQVSSSVKSAYFQLELAQQTLALNQDQREAYLRIEQVAKRRYAAGAISQVDLLNAQVSLYSNSSDIADMQSAERTARAQLNVLLNSPADRTYEVEPFKTSYFPLPSRAEAENRMLESRNEIRSARLQLDAASNSLSLAKYSLLPDLFVTVGAMDYKFAGASPWSTLGANYPTYTYMASLQISIPIFGLLNERQVISSARHDRANAEASLQLTLNQSRVALVTALENLKALGDRLKNNEDHLLPLSDQAFNLALINYSAGKIDFQALSETATARRTIRQAHLQSISSYLMNYATLGQLLGEDL